MANQQWYVANKSNAIVGPLTTSELRTMANSGALRRDDRLSQDRQKWYIASTLRGLFLEQAVVEPATLVAEVMGPPLPSIPSDAVATSSVNSTSKQTSRSRTTFRQRAVVAIAVAFDSLRGWRWPSVRIGLTGISLCIIAFLAYWAMRAGSNGESQKAVSQSVAVDPTRDETRVDSSSDPQMILSDDSGGISGRISSQALEHGQVIVTTKIPIADGLYLTVMLLVFDKAQPDAIKMNGLYGLVILENLFETKDYHLTKNTVLQLRIGDSRFSLFPSKYEADQFKNGLEYGSLSGTELLAFLKGKGTLSVVVNEHEYTLADTWMRHVADFLQEVDTHRAIKGYGESSSVDRASGTTVHNDASEVSAKNLREITNTIGMRLVLIPAGEFQMGEPAGEADAEANEKPQHRVRITKPYYLGIHEVTRGQFAQFVQTESYKMEAERDGKGGWGYDESTNEIGVRKQQYTWRNTGWPMTDDHPVVNVSWNDALAFCTWLSRKEGKAYRLPTEAEWEYACRAGTTTKWSHGNDPEGLATIGNVADRSFTLKKPGGRDRGIESNDGYVFSAPVGNFLPNRFGLYDMTGNVWEWCGDWYGEKYYGESPSSDPSGPRTGSDCVTRGGSWNFAPADCRSAVRSWNAPDFRFYTLGFRVALVP